MSQIHAVLSHDLNKLHWAAQLGRRKRTRQVEGPSPSATRTDSAHHVLSRRTDSRPRPTGRSRGELTTKLHLG